MGIVTTICQQEERVGAWPQLLHRMVRTVKSKALFRPEDRLLVAVSGGADSVALLSLLHQLRPVWKLALTAVHFNYALRGEESEADAAFVSTLCRQWDVELVTTRLDVKSKESSVRGSSLQERAREARYQAMRNLHQALGMDRIILGHTADDQAETVLMWMLRGAGLAGLSGMPVSREGLFVRPLLHVSRADILMYLDSQGVTFRSDSSNAKPLYLRNRVRHEVLPAMKRLVPAAVQILGRQAEILREDECWLERSTLEEMSRLAEFQEQGTISLNRDGLLALPLSLQRRIIRATFQRVTRREKPPSFAAVSAVLEHVAQGRSGSRLNLRDVDVVREYTRIRFCPHRTGGGSVSFRRTRLDTVEAPISSATIWPSTGQRIEISLLSPSDAQRVLTAKLDRTTAVFDADRFTHRLSLRTWRRGDSFCPLGMRGQQRKLQDYFTDLKLSRDERHRVPLLVAPEGILWVAGYRSDERFRVRPSSSRYLMATIIEVV